MKSVLKIVGVVVLLACCAFGIAVAGKLRDERAVHDYCEKVATLAKAGNVALGDNAKCEARTSFLADNRDPMAKARWKMEKKCADESDSWAKLQECQQREAAKF